MSVGSHWHLLRGATKGSRLLVIPWERTWPTSPRRSALVSNLFPGNKITYADLLDGHCAFVLSFCSAFWPRQVKPATFVAVFCSLWGPFYIMVRRHIFNLSSCPSSLGLHFTSSNLLIDAPRTRHPFLCNNGLSSQL